MTRRPRPATWLGLLLLLASAGFLTFSDQGVARGIRHAGLGAVLALVPEESQIADQLRSLVNRTRLSATEAEKAKEDLARMGQIRATQGAALDQLLADLAHPVELIPAKALAERDDSTRPPSSLLVDRGQKQGVGVQALAFTPDGLAGLVAIAEDHRSLLLLLSDPQCQIAARVDGAGETGLLCGLAPESISDAEGPLLQLKYLSRYANPEPGTEVRSSGLGGLYPANLLLGTLVSYKAGDLYGEALIRPAVKFANLETILLTRATASNG